MKVYGLTGGVGTGKSTADQLLRQRGIPVVDTDLLARQIVEPGQPALREIESAFGSTVISPLGELRRGELARIVFSDLAARQKLEGILHPRIRMLWKKQVETWRGESRPLAAVVIPLLFETGAESELDITVCLACSSGTQQRRLSERGWTAAQIERRRAAQWPLERKMLKADHVVWNESSLAVLAEQLDRVIR